MRPKKIDPHTYDLGGGWYAQRYGNGWQAFTPKDPSDLGGFMDRRSGELGYLRQAKDYARRHPIAAKSQGQTVEEVPAMVPFPGGSK